MSGEKAKIDNALMVVYKVFPEAELINRDGSCEKLSAMFGIAVDVKSVKRFHVSCNNINQQLSLDFGACFKCQKGGGT